MFDFLTFTSLTLAAVAFGGFIAITLFLAMLFRTVVPTNDMHVVQSAKKTISYGKDQTAGNTYYAWPSWLPIIGIKVIKLPMSVFDVALEGYPGYDKGRVPFVVDIMAFFRITDTNLAAQRVLSQQELLQQLQSILQGSVRAILAQSEIEEILEGRGKFGEMFTKEVDENLKQWGVQTVKCIELMDIRDAEGSVVIANIMAKKKSLIEKESRIEVANNKRAAEEAEIIAKREVELQRQTAEQTVGQRTAEKEKQVGIAVEQSRQEIKEQAKITAEKDMAVKKVEEVRKAEIAKDVQVVQAEQDKQTSVIKADGEKQKTVLIAEGNLEAAKRNAEGITVEGNARGAAEQALLMAPVNSQITLAKEIGENNGYQTYLIEIRRVEATQAVGVAQAAALEKADVKVIANAGDAVSGVKTAMDLFSSKGGTAVGSALEALAQTEQGQALLSSLVNLGATPKDTDGTVARTAVRSTPKGNGSTVTK
jgi:flotillin